MSNFNNITEFLNNIDNALNLDTMGDSKRTFIDSKAEIKVSVAVEECTMGDCAIRYVVHVRSTKLKYVGRRWGCIDNDENKVVSIWMAKNRNRIHEAEYKAENIEEARMKAILG